MKHLKSLKREIANCARYAITCKDTDGNIWALVSQGSSAVHVVAIEKDESKPFNVMAYTMTKPVYQETRKALAKKNDAWWSQSLEDYEEGQKPLTLNKKTLEALCLGISYASASFNAKD